MPMSEAAMDGIRVNGHRWQHRIGGLKTFTEVLGRANDAYNDGGDYDRDAVEKAVEGIVHRVRSFAQATGMADARRDLEANADDLEMNADEDIEDINYYMNRLYDSFDFYRILVSD